MNPRIAPCIAVIVAVSLMTTVACSSDGDKVDGTPSSEPLQTQAADDERAGDATDNGDMTEQFVEQYAILYVIGNAERRLSCHCEYENLGFDNSQECIAEYLGGISELDEQKECFMDAIDQLGEPPPEAIEYFGCMEDYLNAGAECLEDDLENDYCDRRQNTGAIGEFEACVEPYEDELDACEQELEQSGETVLQWMAEFQESTFRCP